MTNACRIRGVMPSWAKSCITANRSRGCWVHRSDQLAAVDILERYHGDLEIGHQGIAGAGQQLGAANRVDRAAHDEVDSNFTSIGPRRTSRLVSEASAAGCVRV